MITKHVAKSSKSVKAKPFGCSCLAALTALELSAEPEGGDDGGRQNRPCLRRGSAQRAGCVILLKPATDSYSFRPPIPKQTGH
jgi:hypothetical protein